MAVPRDASIPYRMISLLLTRQRCQGRNGESVAAERCTDTEAQEYLPSGSREPRSSRQLSGEILAAVAPSAAPPIAQITRASPPHQIQIFIGRWKTPVNCRRMPQ